jgi:hypothetical protein
MSAVDILRFKGANQGMFRDEPAGFLSERTLDVHQGGQAAPGFVCGRRIQRVDHHAAIAMVAGTPARRINPAKTGHNRYTRHAGTPFLNVTQRFFIPF